MYSYLAFGALYSRLVLIAFSVSLLPLLSMKFIKPQYNNYMSAKIFERIRSMNKPYTSFGFVIPEGDHSD